MTGDMTAAEVQQLTGLRGGTFWRHVWAAHQAGELHPFKWGNTYRFDRKEVSVWRAAHRLGSPADLLVLADGRAKAAKALRAATCRGMA